MTGEKIILWREDEYDYPDAYGFVPFLTSYSHEDSDMHPAMIVVPGGAYRKVSPSEAQLPAMEFYRAGYNVFVLTYTINLLDEPLGFQPLNDIARAVRLIRARSEIYFIDPDRIALCGFRQEDISVQRCVCIIWMLRTRIPDIARYLQDRMQQSSAIL